MRYLLSVTLFIAREYLKMLGKRFVKVSDMSYSVGLLGKIVPKTAPADFL